MDSLEQFLAVYELLTPENRARLFQMLEEALRSQEASTDSQKKEQDISL